MLLALLSSIIRMIEVKRPQASIVNLYGSINGLQTGGLDVTCHLEKPDDPLREWLKWRLSSNLRCSVLNQTFVLLAYKLGVLHESRG